ncbi:MAG: VOC family protein [Phycisphaerales bacterium]|nr:VOC family protein [Phycisphaerales bacterium]
MAAKPVPEGFSTVSAHLMVKGADAALAFYKKAFGAEEVMRMPGPDGKTVMHAELRIGDSTVMLCDEWPGPGGCKAPATLHGTTVTIHLYVNDCDKVFAQAVEAGAKVEMPLMDTFWGDRYGKLSDPYGHHWGVATHKQDLTPEQIQQGAEEFMKNMAGKCGQG